MKRFLACVCLALLTCGPARAFHVTLNEADNVRFDFQVTDFDVPGGSGVFQWGPWGLVAFDHLTIDNVPVGEFAVSGPNNLFDSFFAGFFIQGFGVSSFQGTEVLPVPGGFRFIYGEALPVSRVADLSSSGMLLLLSLAGIGLVQHARSCGSGLLMPRRR